MLTPSENETNIETICGGAAIELINNALALAYANIMDINCEAEKKREVVFKITLTPNESRDLVEVGMFIDNKNAPAKPTVSRLILSRGRDGVVNVNELINEQQVIDFNRNLEAVK